jgi:hypothetical protein
MQATHVQCAAIAALAILGVTPLVAAEPNPADVQAATAAADKFYQCAGSNVADYDDGISGANIVAKAIAAQCRREALDWVNALAKYTTQSESTAILNELVSGEDANLIAIVLRHRVSKR